MRADGTTPGRPGPRFGDRIEAGDALGDLLVGLPGGTSMVVGLPRGGVAVGLGVARRLGVPLDVLVVRKLGIPFHPETAFGAIGEGGIRVVDASTIWRAGLGADEVSAVEAAERQELQRRVERYRAGRSRIPLAGRTVVIVDDGLATGASMLAAVGVARAAGAHRVVVAAPVASPSAVQALADEADQVVVLVVPEGFRAVGECYEDFHEMTDDEVTDLLAAAAGAAGDEAARPPFGPTTGADPGPARPSWATGPAAPAPSAAAGTAPVRREARQQEVVVTGPGAPDLAGTLDVPADARGVVLFAHGSGSSHRSPRNRMMAAHLAQAGFATLLFDLLTPAEAEDRANVFDIDLLARRLLAATTWVRDHPSCRGLPVGLFGASTGAGAALRAAAEPGAEVATVVSRGGRPDLAGSHLGRVRCPVLLVVGEADPQVLELKRWAATQLGGPHALAIVPGAGHLFEEPGTLEQVALVATDWFDRFLVAPAVGPVARAR